MKTKSLLRLVALLAVLGLVAAACGSDDADGGDTSGSTTAPDVTDGEDPDPTDPPDADTTTEAPAPSGDGGSISYGLIEPSWIDSFNTQDSEGFEVARLLFDGLTDYSEDLSPVPAVATDWSTDDNVVWTFNLRDDVTFHDGTPVTAQSFVDAFNRVANPDNLSDVSYQGYYSAGIAGWADVDEGTATEVTGAVAIDDTTLEITLESGNPVLPKILSHPVFSPVNLAAVEAGGDGYSDAPVGNGPYQMDGAWQHDVAIDLVRYDGYYDEPGVADAINFGIYDSVETMYLEAQAGNLNISDVPPENITTADADFGGNYIDIATGVFQYLGYPTTVTPFDNVDIRRALSMAVDRDTISEQVFAGTRAPAKGFAPPLAPGNIQGCQYTEYDPDAAKALFDEAGGIPGDAITFYFNSGGGHEVWTQAVANGWQQTFGIEAEFVAQEFAPYLDQLQAGDIDGPYRLGWAWDAPTAENFLSPLYGSESTDNYSGYASAEFDAAIADFKASPTEEDGFPALATAQEILCEDMPVLPMFFSRTQKVFTDDVSNVNYSVFGFTLLEEVTPVG